MKIEEISVAKAEGLLLAHSQNGLINGQYRRFKKGHRVSKNDITALQNNGLEKITIARLAPDDVSENDAAQQLAEALSSNHIYVDQAFTGRCNLYAESDGLTTLDTDFINKFNAVDPAITLATLPNWQRVQAGQMVATVKIIPFAVPGTTLQAALSVASETIAVAPFKPHKVGLIATELPVLKTSTMDKTRSVLEARLAKAGSILETELRVPHRADHVANAITTLAAQDIDLIVLFGASAMIDMDDILPESLRMAGGVVHHVGMPVDPGNLLFIGEVNGIHVIGAPGCARSPAENGFDWVLNRILADIEVTHTDIQAMGVGGLLKEIVTRPQPRRGVNQTATPASSFAGLILAGGKSSRLVGGSKLLAELDGKPLIRHVADAALDSRLDDLIMVTGSEKNNLHKALEGLRIRFEHNDSYATGQASSIRAGLEHLTRNQLKPDGLLILLGDMPRISNRVIDRILSAFAPSQSAEIIVPTYRGGHGNPVLWSSRFFEELATLDGDRGARALISTHENFVRKVEIGPEVAFDIDTREELEAARSNRGR